MDNRNSDILIAIGATVSANCIPCTEAAVNRALELGIGQSEIWQAIRVGRMVRDGAARKWEGALEDLLGVDESAELASAGGCPLS